MKKINIIKYIIIGTIGFGFISCTRELDINVDPNNPIDVPIKTILPSAQVNLGYTLGGEATRMPASIMQYYAGHRAQLFDYAIYNITSASTDSLWRNLYGILMNLREIQRKGNTSGDKIYVGMSQLLEAYTWSVTTDIFGDIPFSQALQGSSNINPAYDSQGSIYPKLIGLIEVGITNLKSNQGTKPSNDDFIFSGDITKWEKFGNSLKLRLLNHLSKKDATAAIDFLNQNPILIDDSSDNSKVPFFTNASNSNPIYQFDVLSGRKDNAVSSTIVNKLKTLNDPRVDYYFKPIENGTLAGQIIGNDPGDNTDDSGENLYSRVGSAYASANSPVILISAAEVNFIKAEIYFRLGNQTSAKDSYNKAIKQDFKSLGLEDNSASTYLESSQVAYNNTLQRIIEQKWITMYQAPFEAWVDWRRTGFPNLNLPSKVRTDDFIPRRLPYPQIEINTNRGSLEAGPGIPIPFQGMKVKMWWEQ